MKNYITLLSFIALSMSTQLGAIHGFLDERNSYGEYCAKKESPADRADCWGVIIKETKTELQEAQKNGAPPYKINEIKQRLDRAEKQDKEHKKEMRKKALQSGS